MKEGNPWPLPVQKKTANLNTGVTIAFQNLNQF